jgi:hypothetical protein
MTVAGTHIQHCRQLAQQESRILRHWARNGRTPTHQPLDYWGEWTNRQKRSTTSFTTKTAA